MSDPFDAVFEGSLEAIFRRGGAGIAAVRGTESGGAAFDLIEMTGRRDCDQAAPPLDAAATFVRYQALLAEYLAARREWDTLAHEDSTDSRSAGYRDNLPEKYEALLAKFRIAGEFYCACFGEDAAPCTIDDGASRTRAAG